MRCSCGAENPSSSNRCATCGNALPAAEANPAAPARGANLWKDSGIAAALLGALAVVYLIDWLSASPQKSSSPDVKVVVRQEEAPAPAAPVKMWRLGVTPRQYDDM